MTKETYRLVATEQKAGGLVCVIDRTINSDGFNGTTAEIAHGIDVPNILISIPEDDDEAHQVIESMKSVVSLFVTIEADRVEHVWRSETGTANYHAKNNL